MDIDLMLKKYGVKYEDLNAVERETFQNMINSIQSSQLTIERLRESLIQMRDAVMLEISTYNTNTNQDLFCKARIRNYTLIISLLEGPEKAKKAFEQALSGVR